ncbi:hypothetical protein [Nannocystis pusilla]|uniref:RCC1 domain-containing protein n=1 Tax=Nannocystis pusilla TaxID=889268 RepID=UPI003B7A4573
MILPHTFRLSRRPRGRLTPHFESCYQHARRETAHLSRHLHDRSSFDLHPPHRRPLARRLRRRRDHQRERHRRHHHRHWDYHRRPDRGPDNRDSHHHLDHYRLHRLGDRHHRADHLHHSRRHHQRHPGTTTLDTTSTTLDTTTLDTTSTTLDTTTSTTADTTTSTTSDTTTGAVDDTPPAVVLARPFDNIHLASRRLVVTGQASDDTEVVAVDLVVNGEAPVALTIVPGPVLEFSADLRLRRGWNTIELVARDAADNSGSSVRHVHLGVPVAAGGAHSLALTNDGAWGFGRNNEGQLGVGDLVDRLVPTAALGLDDAVSLSANLNHSLAVTEAGAVVVWGRNDEGQLGQAPGADVSTPALLDLPEVVLVAAGQRHSLALTEDGQVWSFGFNNAGQLGRDGDSLPAVVPGLEDIVAIAAGGTYSLAVDGTGAVWAWGNNTDGQLGDGMTVDSPVPKAISMVDAVAVAAGKAHTLAVAPLGNLAACGLNVSGQLGDGMNADNELLPVAVPEFADVLTVAASGNLSLGLAGDAALWAWGQNFSGQLGLGDNADRPAPTLVPGLPPCGRSPPAWPTP